MSQFKRVKVVMLPTKDNHSQLEIDDLNTNKLSFELKRYVCKNPQHLYIISNDEIKEGDLHITSDHEGYGDKKYKIIATTDTSLFKIEDCPVRGAASNVKYILPEPSQQFIAKYIQSYNKGEVITDVLVEYHGSFGYYDSDTWFAPKVNSKDNTITIKKLKESWSREEVKSLISKAFSSDLINNQSATKLDKWIKDNL